MMYSTTLGTIQHVVDWLQGSDDDGWADEVKLAEQATYEARQMATPRRRPDKGPVQMVPGDHSMQMALPHLQRMLDAMRTRNRAEALLHGKAALAEFGLDVLSGA